ncbi:MAG: 4Fe-4S binding protein [Planctomycetota bacterium]
MIINRKTAVKLVLVAAVIGLGALIGSSLDPPPRPDEIKGPEKRVPRPELPEDYEPPVTEHPTPRSMTLEYLDIGLLFAALVAASYLAIERRSRAGIFALGVACLAYFGFVRGGCVCPIGATQHVSEALFGGYVIALPVLLFFLLPLAFSLFYGRVFCSSVCPLGAIQDLVLVRPLKVPRWLEHGLGLFAYIYLGLAVLLAATGALYVICRYDPFVSVFRLSGNAPLLIISGLVLLIAMFVGRPYCRFLCPLGVLLRGGAEVSARHATVSPDECVQCRLCEDACPFNAIQAPAEPMHDRRTGKATLGLLLLAVPVIVALGAWLGRLSTDRLAGIHHTVRQARAVRRSQGLTATALADEAEAYRKTRRPIRELYVREAAVLDRFKLGSALFGGWVGLVVGAKLVLLSVRRTRTDYEAEPGQCVACGRCFRYCPREHLRLAGLRGEIDPEEYRA